jgi:hypothetical protein
MTPLFSRAALGAVIAVAAMSFAAAIVLSLAGDALGIRRSAGADGYSASAIGHKGLVQLLGKLDIPVVVSRSNSAERAQHGLLIIAEPAAGDDTARARLHDVLTSAAISLVVLPKWSGSVERGGAWLRSAHLVSPEEIAPVITALALDRSASLVRGAAALDWVSEPRGTPPVIREPQLLTTGGLTAMVADRSGNQLLGRVERDGGVLYVLSDPDALSNAGLRTPANARFMVELIDRLRAGGPVVIDETLHGYVRKPSLVHALLRFPLVLATVQMLVIAVFAVWAAIVRFGPRRAAPPPFAPGKDFLIRNTAALLHGGGHHAHALARYLALSVAAVRLALHAPALAAPAMTAWLERVRLVRGGRISLVELEREVAAAVAPARVVELADQVFRWRMEMTHGIDSRS